MMLLCYFNVHRWVYFEERSSEDITSFQVRMCECCDKKQKKIYYFEFDEVVDILKEYWLDVELSIEEKRELKINKALK